MPGTRWCLSVAFAAATVLSLVNLKAYTQSAVANDLSMRVVHTNSAALAITSTSPQVSYYGGVMAIDFSRGLWSGFSSAREFQTAQVVGGRVVAADHYRMLAALVVTNHDAATQNICVYVPDGGVPNLDSIRSPGDGVLAGVGGIRADSYPLGPGASMAVDFWWTAGSPAGSGTFQLLVTSGRGSCP